MTAFDLTPLTAAKKEDLAKSLTPAERAVILNHGTEAAFCGGLLDNKKSGIYACKLCGLPLFKSVAKFDSGTGWPSFHSPYERSHIKYIEDNSYGMRRVEIQCARCESHLGHVFPDGPPPKGERYCLNSVSMDFFEEGTEPKLK